MARRRKKRTLKPRLPARVRTKRRKGKAKNQQHPELIGLGLVALGVFLASILYLGWGGGMVGGWITDGFTATIGAATYVAPVAAGLESRRHGWARAAGSLRDARR